MTHSQFHNVKYNNNINIKREPNSTNYITTATTTTTTSPITTTTTANNNIGLYPPATCLKINKDSHLIRKQPVVTSRSRSPPSTSPSPPSTTTTTATTTKPRHPVIIYTHSPKVIHTHPKDFMALVQKLTGLSRPPTLSPSPAVLTDDEDKKKVVQLLNENKNNSKNNGPLMTLNKDKDIMENENSSCSSVVTDESNLDNHQVSSTTTTSQQQQVLNSCYMGPPYYDASSSYLTNIPVFTPNISVDHYFCSNNQINSNSPQQTSFYNYGDPLFFTPNMRAISSSSSTLTFEGINNDFCDY